jgi:hypothetical protein
MHFSDLRFPSDACHACENEPLRIITQNSYYLFCSDHPFILDRNLNTACELI